MDDVMSPSLRGSGLKFQHMDFYFYDFHVSLFTREWIEIVIMFTQALRRTQSPSLRGSGLKFF